MVGFIVLPYIIVALTIIARPTTNQCVKCGITMYIVRSPEIFPTIFYNEIIFSVWIYIISITHKAYSRKNGDISDFHGDRMLMIILRITQKRKFSRS